MYRYVWVTVHVASFDGLRAGWNVDIQSSGKVAYSRDLGTVTPLGSQYTEVTFPDEPDKIFKSVRHRQEPQPLYLGTYLSLNKKIKSFPGDVEFHRSHRRIQGS